MVLNYNLTTQWSFHYYRFRQSLPGEPRSPASWKFLRPNEQVKFSFLHRARNIHKRNKILFFPGYDFLIINIALRYDVSILTDNDFMLKHCLFDNLANTINKQIYGGDLSNKIVQDTIMINAYSFDFYSPGLRDRKTCIWVSSNLFLSVKRQVVCRSPCFLYTAFAAAITFIRNPS